MSESFFVLLWPLFARAPCHWFLEFFLLSSPGVQSVFVFVEPRWAPRPFGGARAQKKTPPRVLIFLLRPRRKAGEGEAPLGAGTGPEQKKHPGWCVFFVLWPRRKVAAPNGAQQKKKKHFAHPGTTAKKILETNDTGHEQKGATTKKKTPWPGLGPGLEWGAKFCAEGSLGYRSFLGPLGVCVCVEYDSDRGL